MVTVTNLPTTAAPCTPLTWKAAVVVVAAAGRTAADIADPPSGLVTTKTVATELGLPKVQVTAIVVDDETVVVPQVPFAGDSVTTAPAAKPVPAIANDVVVEAVPAAGVTPVI